MFSAVLEHEQKVSASIQKLYETALKENDYPTQIMLQWFITEQIEEENNDRDMIAKLKMVGDNGYGILMIDAEMAQRVFNPQPSSSSGT